MSNKSKNQAKDAIRALSHIMNASGFITLINPEQFRQGKFDKSEAVAPLSRFLLEVIEQKKMSSNCEENLDVASIKSVFSQHGFVSMVTGDSSSRNDSELSSREILLCVGWILARNDLVNKVVKQLLQNSTRLLSVTHLHCVRGEKDSASISPLDMSRVGPMVQSSHCGQGKVKYLVWLMGRLRLALKALHSEQQAICRHQHRVHDSTQGVGVLQQDITHLSALDTFLLKHPKLMKNHYEELEKEAAVLQACLSWQELEPVFWQWIVSVHEAKQSSESENDLNYPSDGDTTHAPSLRLSNAKSTMMMSQLCNLESSVSRTLRTVESEMAAKNTQQVLQEVHSRLDAAKTKADIENNVKTKLACNVEEHMKASHVKYPLQALQFSYNPDQNKHRQKLRIEDAKQSFDIDLQSEILRLTECSRNIQRELEELREEQQQRLNGFTECLANVVCIPPMSDKR